MQFEIQGGGIEQTDGMRAYVMRRLHYALWRHHDRVVRVTARVLDLNGPRGRKDKACRLRIHLLGLPDILIEDIEADLYTAIGRAADRAGRTVARQLKRASSVDTSPAEWR